MSKRKVLLGLIGTNLMELLSPALFADAFVAAGIDGFYHLMDVNRLLERRLAKLIDATKATGFAGTNITYPFKQEVIALLDAVDPEAAQIGAVNTVAIGPQGRTTGYNFDRRGWRNSFEESLGRNSAKDATVVLVGAGGAGRAVAFALMDLGVAILVIQTATPPVRMRSTLILRAIMARPAAESRANLSGISRLRKEWSTRHRWACAAFPAIRYQFLRSEPRFGPPTSFIRRSKRSSSKPLPPRGPAC